LNTGIVLTRATPLMAWLAGLLLVVWGAALATAAVNDPVELQATHQAGVPLHQAPRGTPDFQRVPDGTRATVLEVSPDGRWVKLSLTGVHAMAWDTPPGDTAD
jgi:hypothetical protein